MSSNLNWLGNKGLDPNAARPSRPVSSMAAEPGSIYSPITPYFNDMPTVQAPTTTQQRSATTPQGPSGTMTVPPSTAGRGMPTTPQGPSGTMTVPPSTAGRGMPTTPQGPSGTMTVPPTQQGMPMDIEGPPAATEEGFIPAYLRRNIGRNVRAEFIVGTSQYTDRVGRIIEVGVNYFVLDDVNSRTHIMCDLYSVKFVTVLQF